MNLGFNKGTLLNDPDNLLTGTGNLIRHIDIKSPEDYRNSKVTTLIQEAIDFAISDKDMKVADGGGVEHEEENIEVLEIDIDEAMKMIERGEIKDGKTIMLLQYLKLKNIL